MITDPYNEEVRRLFADPAHAGTVDDGVVVREDGQGVRIEFSARVSAGSVAALRFRAWGCPHVIAAAETVCRLLEGKSTADLEVFAVAQISELLGIPIEKTGRILVIEDAVRSLARALTDTQMTT